MFTQTLVPLGSLWLTVLVAFVPLVVLLALVAGLRTTAWLATLIAGGDHGRARRRRLARAARPDGARLLYGGLQGVWAIDWITFWGLIIFNTLVLTGDFERFKNWMVHHATADIRIQTLMLAWAFGALLEGLVGFGYPWAVVAPILIGLGIADLDAIRVAALANNAPVSYGALGAPIIALAAVTSLPLRALSASVGHIVAVLALLPPWILLYLVSGTEGVLEAWPLAIVGSLSYIAGQWPVAVFLGPYLPDITGALVSFWALFAFTKIWRPANVRAFGGGIVVPVRVTGGGPGAGEDDPGHGAARLEPVHPARHRRRRVDRAVVAPAGLQPGEAVGVGRELGHRQAVRVGVQPESAQRRHGDPGRVGRDPRCCCARGSATVRPGVRADAPSDVGRAPRRLLHFRSGLHVRLQRHGELDGVRLLEGRARVHRARADSRLGRRRALGEQHVDQHDVRPGAGGDRAAARPAADAAAGVQFGRRGGRQADRAADGERRRVDEPLRAQRGRRHPPQHGVDARHARVPDRDRARLLLLPAESDGGMEVR